MNKMKRQGEVGGTFKHTVFMKLEEGLVKLMRSLWSARMKRLMEMYKVKEVCGESKAWNYHCRG